MSNPEIGKDGNIALVALQRRRPGVEGRWLTMSIAPSGVASGKGPAIGGSRGRAVSAGMRAEPIPPNKIGIRIIRVDARGCMRALDLIASTTMQFIRSPYRSQPTTGTTQFRSGRI